MHNIENNLRDRYKTSLNHSANSPLKKYNKHQGWKLVPLSGNDQYTSKYVVEESIDFPEITDRGESYTITVKIQGDVTSLQGIDAFLALGDVYNTYTPTDRSQFFLEIVHNR